MMIKFLVEEGSFKYVLRGSLLDVELNDLKSALVGYTRILDMYPLDFKEFVKACGVQDVIIEQLKECYEKQIKVDDFIHKKMIDLFNLYLIIGGMPQAVVTHLNTNDLSRAAQVQADIVRLYRQDFSKYE